MTILVVNALPNLAKPVKLENPLRGDVIGRGVGGYRCYMRCVASPRHYFTNSLSGNSATPPARCNPVPYIDYACTWRTSNGAQSN